MNRLLMYFAFLLTVLLTACREQGMFRMEAQGAPMPRSKQYVLTLRQDTLFLDARMNLKVQGMHYRLLDKSEQKRIRSLVDELDFTLPADQHGDGSAIFIFERETKATTDKKVVSGLIPKTYNDFIAEMERMISTEKWIPLSRK